MVLIETHNERLRRFKETFGTEEKSLKNLMILICNLRHWKQSKESYHTYRMTLNMEGSPNKVFHGQAPRVSLNNREKDLIIDFFV